MDLDATLRTFFLQALRWQQIVENRTSWPAIRHGFCILEWIRARRPEPGEFKRACAAVRDELIIRPNDLDGWHHDLRKAEEIFGKEDPTLVVEYSERAATGEQTPRHPGDGWRIYLNPARERSFILGAQDAAIPGSIETRVREQRQALREEEDLLRRRVLRFIAEQPELALEETGETWPALRTKDGALECQLAEESTSRIVGFHVQMAEHVLRDTSALHYQKEGMQFSRLLEARRPQRVIYAPARRCWPKMEFWVDRDSEFMFMMPNQNSGSVNDSGIVQWSLLPFGSRKPDVLRRLRAIDEEADHAKRLAHERALVEECPSVEPLLRTLREGRLKCPRCQAPVEDSKELRASEGSLRYWCRDCGRGSVVSPTP